MSAKECVNKEQNLSFCNCSYTACDKTGVCCECIQNHLRSQQLPACCFPPEVEKSYDRSFKKFVETYKHLLG